MILEISIFRSMDHLYGRKSSGFYCSFPPIFSSFPLSFNYSFSAHAFSYTSLTGSHTALANSLSLLQASLIYRFIDLPSIIARVFSRIISFHFYAIPGELFPLSCSSWNFIFDFRNLEIKVLMNIHIFPETLRIKIGVFRNQKLSF